MLMECELTNCQCYQNDYVIDQFYMLNRTIKKVKLNKVEWKLSTCTCKMYFKDFLGKHIVALSVKTQLTEIDFSFRNIGMKKKRGRKAEAKDWFFKESNQEKKSFFYTFRDLLETKKQFIQ